VLSAAEVGAPHKRDRLWIVADPERMGRKAGAAINRITKKWKTSDNTKRLHPEKVWNNGYSASYLRVANGVASRVDRLKALGNGQVSLCTATAWRLLNDN